MGQNKALPILIAIAIVALSSWVLAAGPGEPQRILIPYHGHVEQNGQPLDGDATFRFRLSDDETFANNTLNWSETLSVSVSSGDFSVVLGETQNIPAAVTRSRELFVRIEVNSVPLGQQRIVATPMTNRASQAFDMRVSEDLDVGGALSVDGAMAAGGTVDVSGVLTGVAGSRLFSVDTGVADDTPDDGPYSRIEADSLKTNGLGVGQLFLEGANIDGNQDIHIGDGIAGNRGREVIRAAATFQAGVVINDASQASQDVVFATPFLAPPVVVMTKGNFMNDLCIPFLVTTSSTGFTFRCHNRDDGVAHGSANPINWIAMAQTQ